ncbi:MAG: LytTR family transcriptional regulator [Saprospirales bacterium]|nr:LytTR family transcriptional regulator [Saprospirales bacterium]
MSENPLLTPCEASQTLEVLLRQFEQLTLIRRTPFPNGNGVDFIPDQDILYLEANGNYCYLFLADGNKMLVSQSLKKAQAQLEKHAFCRIHHSYLINLRHLARYLRGEGGTVVMSNGVELPVSKARKADFLKKAAG